MLLFLLVPVYMLWGITLYLFYFLDNFVKQAYSSYYKHSMTGIACTYRPQIYIYIDIVNHRIRTSSFACSEFSTISNWRVITPKKFGFCRIFYMFTVNFLDQQWISKSLEDLDIAYNSQINRESAIEKIFTIC